MAIWNEQPYHKRVVGEMDIHTIGNLTMTPKREDML
jgi:hypothetical protein